VRKQSQAEQDAAFQRFAYRMELLIQRNRRRISRRTVEGGCVVLQPERFKRRASARVGDAASPDSCSRLVTSTNT
jgi:hypothetical protein